LSLFDADVCSPRTPDSENHCLAKLF